MLLSSMASVIFQQCDCGIEFKIMKMLNDLKQIYTCECGHENKITGTILEMHYRRSSKTGRDQDWTKAETWRIRD